MIGKLLSIGDFLSIIAMLCISWLPQQYIIYSASYLIMKGGIFAAMGNKVSFLDVACGIYIIFMMYGFYNHFLTGFFLLFLAQKTVFMFAL